MSDPLLALMQHYRSRGVLVDTNILLLYFVGRFKRELIPSFRRTDQFTPEDFDLLLRLLKRFQRIVTTPNILSEVNSLSAQLGEPAKTPYFQEFAQGIETLDEHYVESTAAARIEHFPKLGLTDCAILHCAKGQFLVLTDDSRLYQLMEKSGVDVINFSHLRAAAWT
jgi:rRNA-processing protein FCF1